MKQEFIDFLSKLMSAAPEVVEENMTEQIKAFIDSISSEENVKPDLTENGVIVLKYLQENPQLITFKAREIAEGLFISSRTVSGTLRKLVNDGFCDKIGKDPVIYSITEKGKNYNINQ